MAARFFVVDSGGVSRLVQRFPVVDSGGTTRLIQRGFVIDSGGVARQFFSAESITISDTTVSAVAANPATATATYRLENDGNIKRGINGALTDIGDWITPQVNMANYEVRATVTSGTVDGGSATGSWLSLASSVEWSNIQTTTGSSSAVITVEIRRASDGTVMDSASITLSSQRLP